MVFCCIAIVGVAFVYFVGLWARQVFTSPVRDRSASHLPSPPRALTGNGALPVYGHTLLFAKLAGDVAHLFPPGWNEIRWLPSTDSCCGGTGCRCKFNWNRRLGDCFAIFVWGQWRTVVKGPDRCRHVMESQDLLDGWPWTPPKTLLGSACFGFLDKDDGEREKLQSVLRRPLSHSSVVRYAPIFAELAARCLDDAAAAAMAVAERDENAVNKKDEDSEKGRKTRPVSTGDRGGHAKDMKELPHSERCLGDEDDDSTTVSGPENSGIGEISPERGGPPGAGAGRAAAAADGTQHVKLKYDAMRAYTLSLVDGPIMDMNNWYSNSSSHKSRLAGCKEKETLLESKCSGEVDEMMQITDHGVNDLASIFQGEEEEGDIEAVMPLEQMPPVQEERQRWTWTNRIKRRSRTMTTGKMKTTTTTGGKKRREPPSRELMLLHMERIKRGVDVIKMTFGPEWMYVWTLNEYGRAINARMHVEKVFRRHVERASSRIPVSRVGGHSYSEPTTKPFPILSMRDNMLRSKEGVFGGGRSNSNVRGANRPRTRSAPALVVVTAAERGDLNDEKVTMDVDSSPYVESFYTEQDLEAPKDLGDISKSDLSLQLPVPESNTSTDNNDAEKQIDSADKQQHHHQHHQQEKQQRYPKRRCNSDTGTHEPGSQSSGVVSVLERILRHREDSGNGLSRAATTELCILLWLMMDAGNAWTSMALILLSSDRAACELVQDEVDAAQARHGPEGMFSSHALSEMAYVDALLYEAVRLCPPNLGGMKVTTRTVEIPDAGVQIAKNTNIIFCQPTDAKFDIHQARGKKPEQLGEGYPCVELHGFLAMHGLEVPLLVLQSKVFLIVLLQRYSPFVCKRKTLIHRLKDAKDSINRSLNRSFRVIISEETGTKNPRQYDRNDSGGRKNDNGDGDTCSSRVHFNLCSENDVGSAEEVSSSDLDDGVRQESRRDHTPPNTTNVRDGDGSREDDEDDGQRGHHHYLCDFEEGRHQRSAAEVSQTDAMRLFTKFPFPEPSRVILLRPRTTRLSGRTENTAKAAIPTPTYDQGRARRR